MTDLLLGQLLSEIANMAAALKADAVKFKRQAEELRKVGNYAEALVADGRSIALEADAADLAELHERYQRRANEDGPWLPIATAPLDCMVMLASAPRRLLAMSVWHGQCWRHAHSLDPICFSPTHWCPLPEAPQS